MTGLIDYIRWRGDLSFQASPFNAVDNLILARLSYIDFNDLPEEGDSLGAVAARYLEAEEKMDLGVFFTGDTEPLFKEASISERFKNLVLKEFVSIIDEVAEIQFSAVTVELDDETVYIAYRGTDDTLVGWKEDLNMSFMDVVPAQAEALAYLEQVLHKHDYRKVYIGGHSKGGNLAVYAAVHVEDILQSSIVEVFNNDGPGFKDNILSKQQYMNISDRITTLVPQNSVVGLLLEHDETYQVVKSSQSSGIMQHDGFSWEVLGNDFIYLPSLDDHRISGMTTKRTLEKMSADQREAFATVLFDILAVSESKTLTDLKKGGIRNFFKMSEYYNDLDDMTKKAISETLSLFFEEGYSSFLEVTELDQLQEKLKEWSDETKKEVKEFISKLEKE